MKFSTFALLLVAFLLGGCTAFTQKTPEALPTIAVDNTTNTAQPSTSGVSGGVTASGNVIAGQEAQMAFPAGGIVDAVNVAVGDQVAAGDVLVRLAGSESQAAAVDAAKLEQLAAQQELLDAQVARQTLFDTLSVAQTNALQELNDARQAVEGRRSQGCRSDIPTLRRQTWKKPKRRLSWRKTSWIRRKRTTKNTPTTLRKTWSGPPC